MIKNSVSCIEYNDFVLDFSGVERCHTKVDSLLTPFTPYSCNGDTPVTNQSLVLTTTASTFSTAMNFGDSCLVKGRYRMTLQFPLLATSRSGAVLSTEALVDSVSMLHLVISSRSFAQ